MLVVVWLQRPEAKPGNTLCSTFPANVFLCSSWTKFAFLTGSRLNFAKCCATLIYCWQRANAFSTLVSFLDQFVKRVEASRTVSCCLASTQQGCAADQASGNDEDATDHNARNNLLV
jgi:hypothetical protein